MGRIAKNYSYNLMYQLFVIIVPIVTTPYLARVLGGEGVGTYSYIHSMSVIISTIVLLGIYNYGNRQIAYARGDENKLSTVFWQIISARILIAIIGTIVYFLIILWMGKFVSLFIIYYSYLLACFVDCTWLFVGVEDMKWAVIKNTLTKVLTIIGIFGFVKNETDLPVYVFIQGFSVLVSNLLAYSQIYRYVGIPHIDFSNIKKDLHGSILLFLPSIATTVYLQCDKIMIELMTGVTNNVGIYDYAEKIVTIPLTFITVLNTVMMPRIANEFINGKKDNISFLLNKAVIFAIFISCPMTLGNIAIADKLIPWYLGSEFISTASVIKCIAPIIIINSLGGVANNQYFTATNQISILIKSQFIGMLGNIIINAILIPYYGIYGAAIATVCTSLISVSIQYFYLLRQVHFDGLLRKIIKYLSMSFAMYCGIMIITRKMQPILLTTITQIIVGVVLYFFISLIYHDSEIIFILGKIKNFLKKTVD